jgi:hypothetical protein
MPIWVFDNKRRNMQWLQFVAFYDFKQKKWSWKQLRISADNTTCSELGIPKIYWSDQAYKFTRLVVGLERAIRAFHIIAADTEGFFYPSRNLRETSWKKCIIILISYYFILKDLRFTLVSDKKNMFDKWFVDQCHLPLRRTVCRTWNTLLNCLIKTIGIHTNFSHQ